MRKLKIIEHISLVEVTTQVLINAFTGKAEFSLHMGCNAINGS